MTKSKTVKEIISLKDEVLNLLLEHPHLRDNDNQLIATIWINKTPRIELMNAKYFLNVFLAKGNLPSSETIRRTRQRVQQTNVLTRGRKWKERHKEAEIVRKEIHTL